MSKKAYMFDCYDDYDIRLKYIVEVLEEKGYEVELFLADFDHFTKKPVSVRRSFSKYIHVIPYSHNLSVSRILSHMDFSRKCLKIQKDNPADLVYCMVPPNFMAYEFGKYRKNNNTASLIFDICDLWPETFPSKKMKSLLAFPFSIWASLRNNWLKYSDAVLTECGLFRNHILKHVPEDIVSVLYLCKDQVIRNAVCPDSEKLTFAYLGSINHIIDIESIVRFLKEVKKYQNVFIHIIGDGESKDSFINMLKQNDIDYCYHGLVFSKTEKTEILSQCHYGFNMMKDSVCVGLTMKSLDYFAYNLPIINNIPVDTWNLVEEKKIGFNLSSDTIVSVANQVTSLDPGSYIQLKKNILQFYDTLFSTNVFKKQFADIIDSIS